MNYELAKKLKEAGFPQDLWLRSQCQHEMSYTQSQIEEGCRCETDKFAYFPTLEELIEAVQLRPDNKFHLIAGQYGDHWWKAATTQRNFETGSTPTEAVARLWLTLNKK